MDSFNLKQFLIENKLTENSRLDEVITQPGSTGLIKLGKKNTLGPDDFDTFKWKDQPANPNARLKDLESGDIFSKEDFWESDIIGNDSSIPIYGSEDNGVWTFTWDMGMISGFIEGNDFTL